jgi:hypothetical protein
MPHRPPVSLWPSSGELNVKAAAAALLLLLAAAAIYYYYYYYLIYELLFCAFNEKLQFNRTHCNILWCICKIKFLLGLFVDLFDRRFKVICPSVHFRNLY